MTAPMQTSLFGGGAPDFDPFLTGIERTELSDGAWVEYLPNWLQGEQTLFDQVTSETEWKASRRPMYDRVVDVPRLTASLPKNGPTPPVLRSIARLLTERYGEPCRRIGLAWYRDGRDSVAPHGDQIARDMQTTVMATVSCGARRRFLLSPAERGGGGGPVSPVSSVSFDLGQGDLLVMGGTIQRTWRHGVPKTARPVGPRLCIMFRPPWVG
ncbi:alpha-ketoglutarate-dependent dioxygenase AlkB [Actinospongicola halichondriae]|uniref:alpha-ketoglutarate-dependent dioxygenase AlkB n=1 Tax=Actinospongicola halichondriae TaxID=3236844 RepID=UPI003D4C3F05